MLNYRTIDSQCLMGTVGHNCTPLKMCLEPSPLSTTLHGLRQSKKTLGKFFIFYFFITSGFLNVFQVWTIKDLADRV